MNFQDRNPRWAMLPERIRGMFNLNDPRWGRGEDKPEDGSRPDAERPPAQPAGGRG
ncbi:MAG: HflK protein, partial [uncultured bacterium]